MNSPVAEIAIRNVFRVSDNLESAQKIKHRGKSKKAFKEIWKEAESMGLTS